jgi:hypothetical protein
MQRSIDLVITNTQLLQLSYPALALVCPSVPQLKAAQALDRAKSGKQ